MLCSKNSTTEHVIVLRFLPVYYLDTGGNSFGTRKTNGSEITNSYSRSVGWVSNFDKTLYCYLQNSGICCITSQCSTIFPELFSLYISIIADSVLLDCDE